MGWIEIAAVAAIIGVILAAQRYSAYKRSRIYTRLDEHKKSLSGEMKQEYARKDLCTLTHQQNARELKDIKEKVDLIPGMVAQLEVLVNGRS